MGYGHLRPAAPLAQLLGVPLQHLDRPPLGDAGDAAFWARVRRAYEPLTRWSQVKVLGAPAKALLDAITAIPPLHPPRDRSAPLAGTRQLVRLARQGIGRALADRLREGDEALLTTFYSAAVLSELHGAQRLRCVVTDSDVNRVWAPADPASSRIVYFAPAPHTARRLQQYGVRPENVVVTGFPLPHELLGGPELPALKANLAARLVRLDPSGEWLERNLPELERALGPLPAAERGKPPLLVFAVGGAGAQVGIAAGLVPSLAPLVKEGRLRLLLVAGRRPEVAERLSALLHESGLLGAPGAALLFEPDVQDYFARFNQALAGADALWTKPSELTFFGGLGLPLVLAPPVGVHEEANRRWAVERGAGLAQGRPDQAGFWLTDWLRDGVLAGAAWAGLQNLPSRGLYRIVGETQRA